MVTEKGSLRSDTGDNVRDTESLSIHTSTDTHTHTTRTRTVKHCPLLLMPKMGYPRQCLKEKCEWYDEANGWCGWENVFEYFRLKALNMFD